MRTPKSYTDNLAKGIITKTMLSDCLFSVNKRAKNYRDNERKYRHLRYDRYNNEERARDKKEEYYNQKEKLLSILEPECIHEELMGFERRRIYDYEDEYDYCLKNNQFVWKNCFYDVYKCREVFFGDIELKDSPQYHYYLFYDLGDHSFHTPIDECQLEKYPSLQVKKIDTLVTTGKEITELVSTQFVKKVLELVETGKYVLQ